MKPGRVLALVSVVTAALLLTPKSDVPDGNVWGGLVRIFAPAEIEEAVPVPDRIRRVSLGGRYYGECSGEILTVLLKPEPCDAFWQRRADPIQPLRIMPRPPSPETAG